MFSFTTCPSFSSGTHLTVQCVSPKAEFNNRSYEYNKNIVYIITSPFIPPEILTNCNNCNRYCAVAVGRDSSVGTATRYGLDGPGIESRWGARFSAPVKTGPGAQRVSFTMGTGSSSGVKRPVRGVDHPPPSSDEVKERVELYLYSHSGLSWPVIGCTVPLLCCAVANAPLISSWLAERLSGR